MIFTSFLSQEFEGKYYPYSLMILLATAN